MAIVDEAIRFCDSFEAELLLELMLRYWKHPLAGDSEFRNDTLEKTVDALNLAKVGSCLLDEMPASQTNFVAAVWYVESLVTNAPEISDEERQRRHDWLNDIRRCIPSCFVNQSDLD